MNETIDQLIQARFDAVASSVDDSDWDDVVARGRAAKPPARRRPVRIALAVAAAAIAAATTAVAFGWPGRIVDFFQAPPAPQSVEDFFDTFGVAVPKGMSHATLGQAHEVMTASFDANNIPPTNNPTDHTLYVAPRTDGGFCFLWTDAGGGCADPQNATAATTNPAARSFGVEWFQGDFATFADGYVRGDAHAVEARFADGTSVKIPVTWVSAPIDAGFFAYNVPASHWTTSDALASLVALDANGNVVGQDAVGVTQPLDQDVLQTLPDGTKYSLPRRAQAAQATEPFDFRTASGGHAYLWVMPRTGGGSCYLFSSGDGGGFGCLSPQELAQLPALNGGVNASSGVYFAQVGADVASVEFRYANGSVEQVAPVDGFVLHELAPASHLASVTALDAGGKAIFTENVAAH